MRRSARLQSLGVVVGLSTLALWPPRHGAMLVAPLDGDPQATIAIALNGGAKLLGRGPVPGSFVVIGDRARIGAAAAGRVVMVMAAPASACGRIG